VPEKTFMLARALLFSLLVEVTLYGTVAIYAFDASPATAALAALTTVLLLRAALVALTWVCAWVWARSDPSPTPRLSLWRTLLMVLGEYAAFVLNFVVISPFERWWMGVDRLSPAADHSTVPSSSTARRLPVLLVHGYGCSRAAWWWLRRRLQAAGWTVATINLEPIYCSIDDFTDPLARRIDTVLAETGAERLILVGHSMGGLVARAYLQRYGEARVAGLVTLGTPHQGSALAHLGYGQNARQMQPGSPWLEALAKPGRETVVIYSPHDNFVMPCTNLRLPAAVHRPLAGIGHLAMLFSPCVAVTLLAALAPIADTDQRAAHSSRR
jgi:triacylglycerol lipase